MFEKIRKYYSDQLFALIEKEITGADSLLDLGCGYNPSMKRITCKVKRSVGLDVHNPTIEKLKQDNIFNEVVLSDVFSYLEQSKEQSIDVILAMDLVEHFDKKTGMRLIKEMERVAAFKVIINTPNGFVPQQPYDNNPWQEHKSGWEFDEMKLLGYKVWGFMGHKKLRGERGIIKHRPQKLYKIMSLLTQLYTYNNPRSAFSLLCIKDVSISK